MAPDVLDMVFAPLCAPRRRRGVATLPRSSSIGHRGHDRHGAPCKTFHAATAVDLIWIN
jgi:hypothetical protein